MRVGLVSQEYPPETGWGGIGTYTFHLANGLAARGHIVHVISRAVRPESRGVRVQRGVFVHRILPARPLVPLRRYLGRSLACLEYAWAVSRTLARLGPLDVVEVPNWNAEGFWTLYVRHPWPLVTRVHSPYAEVVHCRGERLTADTRTAIAIERSAVRGADFVVTHSRANAESAARLYGLRIANIQVIPHGIPLPGDAPARHAATPLRVLYLGRLERRKGIHAFLDALPAVLDAIPDAEIVIAGQDFPTAPGRVHWRTHAESTMTPAHLRRVRFLGYVDDESVGGLYRDCDLFVAPSLYESFGLVLLEAMARGRAVVSSCVSAIPEVVSDGDSGLLVPPGDATALAGAIVALLRDHDTRAEMGRRGRERVKRFFDVQTMVDRVVEFYGDAVEARQ